MEKDMEYNGNIIQKNITFEISFILPLIDHRSGISANKALHVLKQKYNINKIKKSWTWRKPFSISVTALINIIHDVDIEQMRQVQHELLVKKKKR